MQPDLLLLDEVTSALDPELVAEVLEVIRELAQGGMTMLIATHEMGFARDVAHRVCFLHEGRILEEGPPEQIFTAPREERTQQFLQRIVDAGRLSSIVRPCWNGRSTSTSRWSRSTSTSSSSRRTTRPRLAPG